MLVLSNMVIILGLALLVALVFLLVSQGLRDGGPPEPPRRK